MRLLEEAADADTKHWGRDFWIGLCCDTGTDGIPVDRELAQRWYEKAMVKAKNHGLEQYAKDMEKFLEYYHRPYGNFMHPDATAAQTRRLQTALLMCVHCSDGNGGILSCNVRNGMVGYALDFPEALRIIRQLPDHSPAVLRLLEDYDAMAKASSVIGLPAEERRERFNALLGFLPNSKRLSDKGADYHFFLFGLLFLTDRTPYYGLLRAFIESDIKYPIETAYVKFFSWAIQAGSAEGMYMQFQELEAFRRVYHWDENRAGVKCREVFLDYTGKMGWNDEAKRVAEKFFPGTGEGDWIFD